MAKLHFYQVDVFTDRPLCGNPLAVFLECDGLADSTLQSIAREMNLSETVFVFPPENPGADFKIRIFTPGKEIPFAGHPTLGTADTLRRIGQLKPGSDQVVLELGVGPIKVVWQNGLPFMQQPEPVFEKPFPLVYRLGEALGIPQSAIHTWWPAQVVSTGFPALLVPLQSLESIRDIRLNLGVLREILGPVDMIYPFTLAVELEGSHVHTRGFAPFVGIPEDPATGSVGGAMGAYLAHHEILKKDSDYAGITIEQGIEMGRPSQIQVRVEGKGSSIQSVWVGGSVQPVIEGDLTLPE